MVPPSSTRVSRAPAYSLASSKYKNSCTGLSPSIVPLPSGFHFLISTYNARALPISLATTLRISVDFFSSGYLDVSVPRVRFVNLCIQLTMPQLPAAGCPIRISLDQSSLSAPQSFSQTTTSFFASYCLGIHRMHLFH
jgi:hypothetical protein